MPRKAIFPPKIHVDRGYARVFYRDDWYHLGPAGSSEADAKYKEYIVQWAAEQNQSTGTVAANTLPITAANEVLPIKAVCARYLMEQRKLRAGKRELENICDAVQVLDRIYGTLPANQFGTEHLERLQELMGSGEWMTDTEKEKRIKAKQPIGWCKNRVNLQTRRIRAVFRWAERKKLVPPGTWHSLLAVPALDPESPLARDTEPRQPSRYEDVQRVASRAPDAVAAILLLMWWSGMRTGEALIMRTMDVDTSRETWWYKPGSELPYGRHKNAHRKQYRVVPLGPESQKILRPWLRPDKPAEYLFQPTGNRAKQDCYNRHSLGHAIRRACEKAGVSLTSYQGRHAAKERITREHGIEAAAAVLGQKRLASTEGYGGGIDLKHAEETAKKAC